MNTKNKVDLGTVQVDKKVIAEIISSVISDVNGVCLIQKNIGNRFFEVFGQKDFPGITVKVDENSDVTLELKVLVQYGMNIPDAARQVQEAVKAAIDKTLDVNVKDINVNVQGIARGKK